MNLVRKASSAAGAIGDWIAEAAAEEEKRVKANHELDNFVLREQEALAELKARANAAAASVSKVSSVTVKLRNNNTAGRLSPSKLLRKQEGVTVEASLDSDSLESEDAAPLEPLALHVDAPPDADLRAHVQLPDGSTARLTRREEGVTAFFDLAREPGSKALVSFAEVDRPGEGDELTLTRLDGSGSSLVLSKDISTQVGQVASSILNFASFGTLCCAGDTSSTVYDATRVAMAGGPAERIGRVIVDNWRGKPRTVVLQMTEPSGQPQKDAPAKLDLLLLGLFLSADLVQNQEGSGLGGLLV